MRRDTGDKRGGGNVTRAQCRRCKKEDAHTCERGGSVSKGKKEKKKKGKDERLTAGSCAPCRKVQHKRTQEKGDPPAFVNERG